jgi:hypothetical protein
MSASKSNTDVIKQDDKYILETTHVSQRIVITQMVKTELMKVTAPLQDNFGFSVGSEFATPFDIQNQNNMMAKFLYLTNQSQKIGIRMNKMYSNPVPTEISFDMEFSAYYNAFHEVVVPSVILMTMSLGRAVKWEDLTEKMKTYISAIPKVWASTASAADSVANLITAGNATEIATPTNKAMDLLGIIEAPTVTTIKFGNTYTLTDCFITHVGVKFSNVLDTSGYPTSAVCSVTATPQGYPIAEDVIGYFAGSNPKTTKSPQV